MSTTDNNKLLAEFLGWHSKKINVTASRPKGEGIEMYLKEITEYKGVYLEYELLFDTDWNWLMQVVEKIESLDVYYNKYIDYNSSMFTSGKIELSTKIDAVYNACVEFVKWYNLNK